MFKNILIVENNIKYKLDIEVDNGTITAIWDDKEYTKEMERKLNEQPVEQKEEPQPVEEEVEPQKEEQKNKEQKKLQQQQERHLVKVSKKGGLLSKIPQKEANV